jgi:hypothetical protein
MIPRELESSQCWKLACPFIVECIPMIDLDRICDLVLDYREKRPKRTLKEMPVSLSSDGLGR